jgi:transcription antitermination protein NusB
VGARTSGREAALQILFSIEAAVHTAPAAVKDFWREFPGDPEGRAYSEAAVMGITGNLETIDETLRSASENWKLARMTRVDRNILRLGTWELDTQRSVPRAVLIDEAVDLAKRYGSEQSGAFVNGVLNRIADIHGRTVDDADDPKTRG